MKQTFFLMSLLSMWLLSPSAFAENPLRCPNGAFPADKCEAIRSDALRNGCIDQATYNRLKAETRFPACVGSTNVGDCPCGCFAPDTLISVLNGKSGAEEDVMAKVLYDLSSAYQLNSLDSSSTLNAPQFVGRGIANATAGDESQPLVRIETNDGRVLRITEKHPVVKSSGEMVTARELTAGDQLVDESGHTVSIAKLSREAFQGQVYNFETNGKSLAAHIIVAEGVLVGDLAWQNSLEEELGGIAIRQ